MQEIMQSIDWMELISALWAIVILPLLTYIGKQIHEWTKAKKIDKYSDILYKNVTAAVKDVYETTVKDIKGTEDWTPEKQNEVKELAKTKAIQALSNSAYQILKAANNDFSAWLDSLVGTALYDLKNK
jgi:hypothetical protein